MKVNYCVITILLITKVILALNQKDTTLKDISFKTKKSGLVMKCFWFEVDNFIIFDLKQLENSGSVPFDFTSSDNKKVYYNFCENVKQKTCNGTLSQILTHNTENDCKPFASSYKNKNTWELLDAKDINKGVKITLNSNLEQNCNDKGDKYTVVYEIECDKESVTPKILNGHEFNTNSCLNTLRFKSKYACPDSNILAVIQFFENRKEIFASIIIIGGLYLLILGTKLITPTTYLISVLCIASLVFIVIIQFTIPSNAVHIVIWVVLGISIIAGAVIGFFIAKFKKELIGVILGGYSGYLIGTLIYTSITCRFFPDYTLLVNICTDVVMIIIFMIIAFFCFKYIVILSTSLIGSYGLVRGIGILVGNFPNERVIISLLQNGEKEQWSKILTPWLYAYLAGWILLFIGGVAAQYFLTQEEKENDKFPSEDDKLISSWE